MTPERALMIAIVNRAVEDAKSLIARKYGAYRYQLGSPSSASAYPERDLRELMSQLKHEWFGQICAFAGIHQDTVLRKIKKLEERAKLKHASRAN